MSFFPRKLRKTLSGSMMVRFVINYAIIDAECCATFTLVFFLERTNPVVNPVVASQKS